MPLTIQTYLKKSNIRFGIFRQYKLLRQLWIEPNDNEKQILLILGCQRSGTSMVYWIFERDLNTKIFRESSSLSSNDKPKRLRLNSLPKVQATLYRQKAPIIILKPLVESQRAPELLERIFGSKALWMYRNYRDVASSNVGSFGVRNSIEDLRPIVANAANNWRSENVSPDTRTIVCHHFSEDMDPHDAAALFWFARNRLFFDLDLQHNPKAMLCSYEDLCTHPAIIMRAIYAFVECQYPGDHILEDVHHRSVGKGRAIQLSPEVEALCAGLWSDLNSAYHHVLSRAESEEIGT